MKWIAGISIAAALAGAWVAVSAEPAPSGGTVAGRVIVRESGKPAKRDEVWAYLVEDGRRHRPRTPAAKSEKRAIRQKHLQFTPHVLVVPVGTEVAFPNDDADEHNVFSPTDPPGVFDLGRSRDPKGKTKTFADAGEIAIYCDIHVQMWARIKVVDTDPRFIVQVGADGRFSIRDVPPGAYKLHVWTYASDEVIDKVSVTAGETVTAFDQNLQLGTMPPHRRLDGSEYPPKGYPP
jgi:plastocyanin